MLPTSGQFDSKLFLVTGKDGWLRPLLILEAQYVCDKLAF